MIIEQITFLYAEWANQRNNPIDHAGYLVVLNLGECWHNNRSEARDRDKFGGFDSPIPLHFQ